MLQLDFGKLGSGKSANTVTDPQKIFHALPQRDPRYAYLRDVQGEVLSEWYIRRAEKDLVVKMNTGSGKTVTALLMLKSSLNEGVGPAVFITPDHYLAGQAIQEAKALGIETVTEPRDPSFLRGDAVLIIPIHTLINGMSKFGVGNKGSLIEIGTLLIDDAHACLATTEDQFRLVISNKNRIFTELLNLFSEDIKAQSAAGYIDIQRGDPVALQRVPYWGWIDKQSQVLSLLATAQNSDEFKWVWPLIKDSLELCSCIFSGDRVEIAPNCLPIRAIPSVIEAKRRIYMTATLSSDSVLITDFDADVQSVEKPISPKNASDLGDRMILVPQEINTAITDEQIKAFAAHLSKNCNVVVIVPSEKKAQSWASIAKLTLKADNIQQGVDKLRANPTFGLVVLINKYDGIDLPHTACRVLIIDGLPDVRSNKDKIEQVALAGSALYRSKQIQRVEQGMGRGIRAQDDYCVVLLVGPQLTQNLNTRGAISHFTVATRAQLELSRQVTEQIKGKGLKEIEEVINILLTRNPQWAQTAKSVLIDVAYPKESTVDPVALSQRTAFDLATRGRFQEASDKLRAVANSTTDKKLEGWLLQQTAEYLYKVDKVRAHQTQAAASELSYGVLKPLEGIAYKKIDYHGVEQAKKIAAYLTTNYSGANEIRIAINALISSLIFASDNSDEFEDALDEVANFIGFGSQRPDKQFKKGPDVLWALGELKFLVIECKSSSRQPFVSKDYSGQLNNHLGWFKEEYDSTCHAIPIIIHPAEEYEFDAVPESGTRMMNAEKLGKFNAALRSFINSIADNLSDIAHIRQSLAEHKFTASAFAQEYTHTYKRRNIGVK